MHKKIGLIPQKGIAFGFSISMKIGGFLFHSKLVPVEIILAELIANCEVGIGLVLGFVVMWVDGSSHLAVGSATCVCG